MKILTQQDFIKQATERFSGKFDYSRVDYVNGNTNVTIICPIHGDFVQRPLSHLHSTKFGCKQCGYDNRKHNKLNTDNFIITANNIHNNKYDYSKSHYVGMHTIVEIICKDHGSFFQTPYAHIHMKTKCMGCVGRIRHSTEDLISFMKQNILNQNLDYTDTTFTGLTNKVVIKCAIHGVFYKTPKEIYRHKSGCQQCELNQRMRANLIGHSIKYFEQNHEIAQLPAMVYVIEMCNDLDSFIKIGITKSTITKRYQGNTRNSNYKIQEIFTKYMSLLDAFILEQKILAELYQFKHIPLYAFKGRTECLKNTPEVLIRIQQLLQ